MGTKAKADRSEPVEPKTLIEIAQAGYLRLLSDPARCRILTAIHSTAERRACVTDICKLSGLSQPTTSHHLSFLRTAGVVMCEREGKNNFYNINTSKDGVIGQIVSSLSAIMK